jgi:hypothetical protein
MCGDHLRLRAIAVFDLLAAGPAKAVRVELQYDTRDPFAVELMWSDSSGRPVRRLMSRDLLDDGLIVRVGQGDVQVRPAYDNQATVFIEMRSGDEWTVFEALADEVVEFLDRTYDVVAPGAESWWMDIDEELEQLLMADSSESD